jgi:hypothetical protein
VQTSPGGCFPPGRSFGNPGDGTLVPCNAKPTLLEALWAANKWAPVFGLVLGKPSATGARGKGCRIRHRHVRTPGWQGRAASPTQPLCLKTPTPARLGPNTAVGRLHLGGIDTALAAQLGPWVTTPLQPNRWRGDVQSNGDGTFVGAGAWCRGSATKLWSS